MPRLEGGPHGLKAEPSARADDKDYLHGVMLPVGPAWLTVMCDAGTRTARWAGARGEPLGPRDNSGEPWRRTWALGPGHQATSASKGMSLATMLALLTRYSNSRQLCGSCLVTS